MSSTIDAVTPSQAAASESTGSARIIHFDATGLRREKMRMKSTADPAEASARQATPPSAARPAANGQHTNGAGSANGAAAVQPAAPRPVQAAAVPQPASASASGTNGAAAAAIAGSGAAGIGMSTAELEKYLIEFVVEQTGYPEEMVELDADLEADLGIDSIKKAQLFGELAEHFEIQIADVSELSLDDFPTLTHVRDFLQNHATAGEGQAAESAPAPVSAPAVNGHLNGTGAAHETNGAARAAAPIAPLTPAAPAPVAAAPAAPSQPAASPAGGTGMKTEELEQFLISFVVEQTGYPEEMVELDADLEADLGIDSIKKAQLFGELAEHFEIQIADVSDLSLDDFPTLNHVREFLENNATPAGGGAAPASQPAAAPAPAVSTPVATSVAPVQVAPQAPVANPPAPAPAASGAGMDNEELEQFLINFVVEQTGYPEEMVELDADLEADLGIDSIKKAQMFGELSEQFEIQMEDVSEMSLDDFPTLRHVLGFLSGLPRKETV